MKWGETIQTGGECPVWLKSDEMFAYTNAFGEWAERASTDSPDSRTWHWKNIGAIRMPEGHWVYGQPLEKPADWAIERAYKLFVSDKPAYALARYIEQYESPPVDPDVMAVREILTAWVGSQHFHLPAEHAVSLTDIPVDFQAALAAYRRHRNV